MLSSGAERSILNLLYTYAERVDAGDFDGVSRLFDGARVFMAGPDQPAVPGSMVGAVMARFVKLYEGVPRTKHLVTNSIIEADGPSSLVARSQFTVLQDVPGVLPLQTVASGRYHDRFATDDGTTWRFVERVMLVDAHGNVSAHLNQGTGL
ncbi:MAG: nuclear transport factor 2 family protein [Acidimicrobiia bacterium]